MKKEKVIKLIYYSYNPVFDAVKNLCKENKPLIIAIDGRCGGGKSTLGALLKEQFDCNLFHMDDFFLPIEMKTRERLREAGGNVHYERFYEEVLKPINNCQAFEYRPYSCKKGNFDESIIVEYKHINIVEGSYSLHPALRQAYDYKIFITIDTMIQHQRILKRNGEAKLQEFLDKWIPMEEYYFDKLNIKNQCDVIIDTTMLEN